MILINVAGQLYRTAAFRHDDRIGGLHLEGDSRKDRKISRSERDIAVEKETKRIQAELSRIKSSA